MTLNEALTECLRDAEVRVEAGSCLWVSESDSGTVWIYMETVLGEITSYRVDWDTLQHLIVMKSDADDPAT